MKSYNERVSDLMASGVPEAVAQTVAAQQIAELQAAAEASATAARQAAQTMPNGDGVPCELKRYGNGGGLQAVCGHQAIVLAPPGPSKDGKTEYGGCAVWYAVQRPTSHGASPKPARFSAGSSSSRGEPEQSALWQYAPFLASMKGIKYYIQDEKGKPAREVSAAEWLTAAKNAVTEFWSLLK